MQNYLLKYLKYKKKYVTLKKGGGNEIDRSRSCSLKVLNLNGEEILTVDNANNITPKMLINKIRVETDYEWALKLTTQSGIIGINQTMNSNIIDIVSEEDINPIILSDDINLIILTLVNIDTISEICDFDLIFNFSLETFDKNISDITLDKDYFDEKPDDFNDFEGRFKIYIYQRVMEFKMLKITFPDEDRTNEIDILTENLMHFLPNVEIMDDILSPLLIELVLSTTESKIWVTVIINLKNKLANNLKFRKSIINTLQIKFENGCTKIPENHNKMLTLVILFAQLFMADFFNTAVLSFIATTYVNYLNTNQNDQIAVSNILQYLFILRKITINKLLLTEPGRTLHNFLKEILEPYDVV